MEKKNLPLNVKIRKFMQTRFQKIIEINKKYAHPQVKMTKLVRISLIFLPIYLFLLLALIVFKFITILLSKGA